MMNRFNKNKFDKFFNGLIYNKQYKNVDISDAKNLIISYIENRNITIPAYLLDIKSLIDRGYFDVINTGLSDLHIDTQINNTDNNVVLEEETDNSNLDNEHIEDRKDEYKKKKKKSKKYSE